MSKILKTAIIGLGARGGETYASAMLHMTDRYQVAAIADTDQEKIKKYQGIFQLSDEMCFDSAESFFEKKLDLELVLICTQDRQHFHHTIKSLEFGYDILLEKPISPDEAECIQIRNRANELNRKIVVCHVLRYTPFYNEIKRILDSNSIGEPVIINQTENVGYWHYAHSFVRGNWRNSEESSPMILAKCCHDLDLIVWLKGKKGKHVSSFGSLTHFTAQGAPEGAAKRCLDGCQAKGNCPFDAENFYLNCCRYNENGKGLWPASVLAVDATRDNVFKAIQSGPYGRCVYDCDNNVVDHQVVNIRFEDNTSATLTMCGLTSKFARETVIKCTKGELTADMDKNLITVTRFGETPKIIDVNQLATSFEGHGGGDSVMLEDLYDYISEDKVSSRITSIDVSVESHLLALAAEKSRLEDGKSVSL